ncbi:UvrD-helicase domain-containing protein [Candidatus Sumerlaeota bacterium]|nr:UvrD-helicase domain-containing protein [Candidatus Sumerlaeota bacterium]
MNSSQKRALDTTRDILVSAGAGSGKTRVLVARFIHLLETIPGISMENIVAITFTEKAAAELRERIQKELGSLHQGDSFPQSRMTSVFFREELGGAYIGTIHSFCRRILGEFAMEAGIDSDFQILDEDETDVLMRDSIDFILYSLARNPMQPEAGFLKILLRYFDSAKLKSILYHILTRRDIMQPHIQNLLDSSPDEIAKAHHKAAESILGEEYEFRDDFELLNALCLKAIAEIHIKTSGEYEKRKGYGTALDFDDLLIRAVQLVETNSAIRASLKRRFRYFLVDEFQDTDPLQWRLFYHLTNDRDPGALFLVGDPKQSIYGFRRADVRLFYKAQDHIYQKNRKISSLTESPGNKGGNSEFKASQSQCEEDFGLVQLQENYRSDPALLDFVNYFFSRIMPSLNPDSDISHDVSYEPLIAQKPSGKGGVEILYADQDRLKEDHPFRSLPREELEGEFIALRIKELLLSSGGEPYTPGDFALLLRSRGYLKSYEEALFRHEIPFVTIGGMGFYERQEIFDIANFLQFLVLPENDPALFGLLRSPFLRIPDPLIFRAAQIKKDSLWDRIQTFIGDESCSCKDKNLLQGVINLLTRYMYESQRKPLSLLLKDFLTETGGWLSLASSSDGTRCLENVEKMLDHARQFDQSGFRSLADFTEELMNRIENAEKEGEAPQPETMSDAVKIMTIHKAKGLEFPVVILPGLSSSLKTSSAPFLVDESHGLAVKIADPESDFESTETCLFSALKELDARKRICEEKRLFYVGATRAEKILILSCSTPGKNIPETRQSWLDDVFGLKQSLKSETPITFSINESTHHIPVHVILPELKSDTSRRDEKPEAKASVQPETERTMKRTILPLILPVPRTPEREIISVTRLNLFHRCALKYYLSHLLGWREDMLNRMLSREETPNQRTPSGSARYFLRGTALHSLIQDFMNGEGLADENLTIASAIDRESFLSQKEHDLLIKDIKKAWDRIKTTKRFRELSRLERKHTELPFTISLEKGFLQGRVDLCFFENGRWNILDFKTGYLSSREKAAGTTDYEIQVESYGLFLSIFSPEQELCPISLFFVEADHTETKEFTRSDIQAIRRRIEDLIQKEINFRNEYAGKNADYGRKAMSKIMDQTCSRCGYSSTDECPCKIPGI